MRAGHVRAAEILLTLHPDDELDNIDDEDIAIPPPSVLVPEPTLNGDVYGRAFPIRPSLTNMTITLTTAHK